MKYLTTIGLEVHVQLKTTTKLFCGCRNLFGQKQNTQTCPICLGMPGVLPVLNQQAIELAVKTGHALNCKIFPQSIFARKNYFYPDLPKGYQISQYEEPLALDGYLEIHHNKSWKKIGITRIHMEEDAGKSMHPEGKEHVSESRIDINRCGVPLVEIVSEPDIESPGEAHEYLTRLKQTLLYVGVSDCNMEEGSLRCDANISIRPEGTEELGNRTELKNLNSFKFVKKALETEISRQTQTLDSGKKVEQKTLSYDAANDRIIEMRSKEESDDYRYFPEPDLIPLIIQQSEIDRLKDSLPELPRAKRERLESQYKIPEDNAEVLASSTELADYFEAASKNTQDYVKLSNWILSEVLMVLKDKKVSISAFTVRPADMGSLVNLIHKGNISGKMAKEVFAEMVESGKPPETIVKEKGLEQISDEGQLIGIIDEIISNNQSQVEQYRSGKDRLFGFFVGQVMKATKGSANPGTVNKMLKEKLDK